MSRVLALGIAMGVDAVQLLITPLLAAGVGEGIDAAIDSAMAMFMTWLRGFHWVFLPTFLGELVPGVDIAPLWTMAAIVTWNATPRHRDRMEPQPVSNPGMSLPKPGP